MPTIVSVSPFRCRVWHLHERFDEHITEESCKAEIESFDAHGQLVPVLGRSIRHADFDVEIICGARRLFVARALNLPLEVELRDISDHEALVAMDAENRHRKDISPYERGLSFARWLREGYFRSQDEMAAAMQVSPSQVSRLLKIARLPAVVVEAFADKTQMREGWGLEFARGLEDVAQRAAIIQAATRIANMCPRPAALDAYRQLKLAMKYAGELRPNEDKAIEAEDGRPLFRVKRHRDSIVVVLPMETVSSRSLDAIQNTVASIMEPQPSEEAEVSGSVHAWNEHGQVPAGSSRFVKRS